MAENKAAEVKQETENVGEITVIQKDGFGTKIKNGAKKVFSSKPAKIVGGVLLAAGGAVVGYSIGKSKTGDDEYYDEEDVDFSDDEVIEDESAIAD